MNAVIEKIAKERMVEQMIEATGVKDSPFILNDLAQEIYLSLLEKDEETITEMYDRKELRWFIQKMITNNLFSKTSPYYKTYKLFDRKTDELKND